MLTLLLSLCLLASGYVTARPLNATRVSRPPKMKTYATTYTSLPNVFFYRNQGVSVGEIDQYEVTLCDDVPNTGYIIVLINVPNNPTMNITAHGWPPVELGVSSTAFTAATVFGTNYIWGVSAMSTMVIPYNVANMVDRTFYIRVTAKVFSTDYNLQLSFSSTGTQTGGHYDQRAFPTQNAVGPFQYLTQYATSGNTAMVVNNEDAVMYFVNFCDADLLTSTYSVTVTVVADPSKPRSAFNLYVCAASQIVVDSCNEYINSGMDEETAIVVSVTLSNSGSQLSQGIYILIEGYGGELDGKNAFFVTAKVEQ